MNFDYQERASQKVSSIIKRDGLSLDDVSAALEAAMNRKGSSITEQKRDIGIEATKRVLENASLTPEHKAVLEVIVLGNGLRPAIDIEKDSFDRLPSVWDDIRVC